MILIRGRAMLARSCRLCFSEEVTLEERSLETGDAIPRTVGSVTGLSKPGVVYLHRSIVTHENGKREI